MAIDVNQVIHIVQVNQILIGYLLTIAVGVVAAQFKLSQSETAAAQVAVQEGFNQTLKFFDPRDTTVMFAPAGVDKATYTMSPEDRARIEFQYGKTEADLAAIGTQIENAERQGLGVYTIVCSGVDIPVEYGIPREAVPHQTIPPPPILGDGGRTGGHEFDPLAHYTTDRGFDANGNLVRGTRMTDITFRVMCLGETDETRDRMRKQVDAAEAAGMTHYYLTGGMSPYLVYRGIQYGTALKYAFKEPPIRPAPAV